MRKKVIALVAHDNKKLEMAEWVNKNRKMLCKFKLVATEGTANSLKSITGLDINKLGHGPDGGDIIIANEVLKDKIDNIMFFVDVRTPHGHEHDIQTLIRMCVLKNIPLALNMKTAEYIIKSELLKNYTVKNAEK